MANNDLQLLDQATPQKSFNPDVIDAGGNVRRPRQSLADASGATINPATVEAISALKSAVDTLASSLLTNTQLRATPVIIKSASDDASVAAILSTGSGADAFAVTPSDTADLASAVRCLWIGVAGDLALKMPAGNVIFKNVNVGFFPMKTSRVLSSGTTASAIIGIV